MTFSILSPEKPISKLAAKTDAESASVTMEAPSLPEFYKDKVAKNLCIVAVSKPAEKTVGGIILAETSREASEYAAQVGRLEAVGPFFYSAKRFGDSPKPEVGNFVLFSPYVGRRLDIGNDRFLIIEDTDILLRELNPNDDFKLYT